VKGTFFLQSPLLNRLGWLIHAFGARGFDTDQRGLVPESVRFSAVPLQKIAILNQVHGTKIHNVDRKMLHEFPPRDGDGLICSGGEVGGGIFTADCLPVIVASTRVAAFALLHGGWRGVAGGIIEEGVSRLLASTRGRGGELFGAVGPGATGCCYEVGEDVAASFRDCYPWCLKEGKEGRSHLDLKGVVKEKLLQSGLLPDNIDVMEECTICDRRFHSFRVDGKSKWRQFSLGYSVGEEE